MSPHWSMDASLDAVEPVSSRFILERFPVMDTWYSPEAVYVCDCMPFVVTVVVTSSPQSIVSVPPVRTSTGMLIVCGEAVTFQVVTKAPTGRVSWSCANAYPGSDASAAKSKAGQVPPACWFGATACLESSACGTASMTTSATASAAASTCKAALFLRQKAPPGNFPENCRKRGIIMIKNQCFNSHLLSIYA